jgi:hypothetical protein
MTSLYDIGAQVLEECEALLALPVTGRRLPERRYVSHGQPPIEECDGALVVWFSQVDVRQVGPRDADLTNRVVAVNIDVWRCWPTGDVRAPSAEELSAASAVVADDCDRLTLGLSGWLANRCGPVEWRPALPLGPQGGLAGWRLQAGLLLG